MDVAQHRDSHGDDSPLCLKVKARLRSAEPMRDLDSSWPHGSQDPIGQAGEFLVWATLITQSGGGLHVFLPELDRGLDALVHRLADGAYLALQVKTKTYLSGPQAVIAVYDKHFFT